MNANLTSIKSKFIALLAAGLTVSSLLSVPQVAVSAEAIGHSAPTEKAGDASEHFGREVNPAAFVPAESKPSYLLSPVQDEAISNALLMFLYLALPAGFGFALWQYDKQAQEQLAGLTLKIVMLERIWRQNPHHS